MSSKAPKGEPSKEPGKKKGWAGTITFCVGCLYSGALAVALIYMGYLLYQWGHYQALIEKIASTAIRAEFRAEKIDFKFAGGLGVSLAGVEISSKGKSIIAVKKLDVGLNFWESLKGSLSLGELVVKEPVVNLVKRRDGTFTFPILNGTPGGKKENRPAAGAIGLFALFQRAQVSGGVLNWEDRSVSLSPVKVSVSDVRMTFSRDGSSSRAAFNVSGTLISGTLKRKGGKPTPFSFSSGIKNIEIGENGVDADIDGKVAINNFNVNYFWPYIRSYVPFQKFDCLFSWNGVFSGRLGHDVLSKGNITLSDIKLRYKEAFSADVKPPELSVDYDVTLTKQALLIERADARMGSIEVRTKGRVKKYKSANPQIGLSIDTNDMDVERLKLYLPDNALTSQESRFLKNNVRHGTVALQGFRFDGDLDKLQHPDKPESLRSFTGALKVAGLTISFKGLTYPFEDINGVISLSKDELQLSGIKGRYGSSILEEISGPVSNIHGWPSYTIYIKADVDLEDGRKLLVDRVLSPELKAHFEQMKQMEGSVKMNMIVAGHTKNPVSSLTMDGSISFNNVGMHHSLIGIPIVEMNGEAELNLNDMNIKKLTWTAGSSPFTLSGKIKDIFRENPSFNLELFSTLALEDLNKVRFITFGDIYDHAGHAFFEMDVSGDFNNFDISNRLDMTNASYRFLDIVQKDDGLRNIYTFKGSVRNGEKLKIRKLYAELGESRVELSGEVNKFWKGEGVNLVLSSDGVLMDDLDNFLHAFTDIDAGGYLSGKLSILKKKTGDLPRLDGYVRFENADFKLPIFRGVFREFNGDMEFMNGSVFLENGEGRFGEGRFRLSAHGKLAAIPEFTLNVDADSLHLLDFIKKPGGAEGESVEQEDHDYLDGKWNIVGKSKRGTIDYIDYQDLGISIKYENKKFHIEPLSFTAYEGNWRWKVDVTLLKGRGVEIDSQIDIQDMNINSYIKKISEKDEIITGQFNIRGKTRGAGQSWDLIKRNMEGSLIINSDEGVIRKFNALAKIFSLLNVSQYFKLKTPDLSVDGMPFNNITASFKVSSGVAHTEDLRIDSEAMRIAATGDYNFGDTNLDMRVAVMPFVTVDWVLSSIPLVGHLLTGDNRGLIILYYDSKGPIGNPEVEAIPFQSLGMKVAGILQRIIELPIKAISRLKDYGNDVGTETVK